MYNKTCILGGLLIMLLSSSCLEFGNKNKEQPIARVYNKKLYLSDIQNIFYEDMTKNDSIKVKNNYIENWIKNQLLLQKAELNLTDEQKNISRELENYRISLLAYKYKQNLIKQKLDTAFSDQEIEAYYEKNKANFTLDKNIIKLLYIKLPRTVPNIEHVRKIYKSEDKEDLKGLEDYCYQYANKYDYCRDEWIAFDDILNKIPLQVDDQKKYLASNDHIETADGDHYYFIKILDYKLKTMISPLSFVKENVKSILLNKRKIELLKDLESNIYNNALDHGHFEIY